MARARWRLVALLAVAALPHAAASAAASTPPPRRRPRPLLVEDADGGDLLLPEDDEPAPEKNDYEEAETNGTEKGTYVGSQCEFVCHPRLHHVFCNPVVGRCECDAKHSVLLGPTKGCAKPKKLGETCFYRQTCRAFDQHASCIQLNHNARCECEPGYHSVTHSRPMQRVFCTPDMALLTADVPTLLGVASGIFVLAGLLCMVLHLYTRARYPNRPAHLADAAATPPCLYSLNDTGGTISMGGRPGSRSSTRSAATGGTLDSGGSRRESRARGVPVSASRAGAARAAAILLVSCHLRAVRRDGGAHPPKCAAQGDLDNVCRAVALSCTGVAVCAGGATAELSTFRADSFRGWFIAERYGRMLERLTLWGRVSGIRNLPSRKPLFQLLSKRFSRRGNTSS